MDNFKTGDLVIRTNCDNGYDGARVGQIAEIIHVDKEASAILVRYVDEYDNYVSCEFWLSEYTTECPNYE